VIEQVGLARRIDLERLAAPDRESITVVIPVRNEEHFVGACLRSVLDQGERDLQVIVVDGGSTDATARAVVEFALADPRVQLIHNPDRIIPRSLNLALRAARGRWFIRVDGHATIPPGYLSRIVAHLRTGQWGGVGGRKDGVGITATGRAIAAAMSSPFGVGNSTYHYGTRLQTVEHIPFGAYPTAVLQQVGGWDERLRVNQDFELDYRLRQRGYHLLFDPQLAIAWHCRQSLAELFAQYRRYGAGKALVASIHPASIRPRHLAAPLLVAVLASGVAVSPWSLWPLALFSTTYLAALGLATLLTARLLPGLGDRLRLPVAFAAMHLGWGIGFWHGLGGVIGRRIRHSPFAWGSPQ
jgi:cellulose synthase/poly-beta-1,6-N-acetylglucosamine synthase-like glycosyltransferase